MRNARNTLIPDFILRKTNSIYDDPTAPDKKSYRAKYDPIFNAL